MANFFAKPKVPTRSPSKETECPVAGPSTIQSDFDKFFKPFVLKKDTQLAPVNWFVQSKKRKERGSALRLDGNVIVIDDEDEVGDVHMEDVQFNQEDVRQMSTRGAHF